MTSTAKTSPAFARRLAWARTAGYYDGRHAALSGHSSELERNLDTLWKADTRTPNGRVVAAYVLAFVEGNRT